MVHSRIQACRIRQISKYMYRESSFFNPDLLSLVVFIQQSPAGKFTFWHCNQLLINDDSIYRYQLLKVSSSLTSIGASQTRERLVYRESRTSFFHSVRIMCLRHSCPLTKVADVHKMLLCLFFMECWYKLSASVAWRDVITGGGGERCDIPIMIIFTTDLDEWAFSDPEWHITWSLGEGAISFISRRTLRRIFWPKTQPLPHTFPRTET